MAGDFQIKTRKDSSEILPYDYNDFWAFIRKSYISGYRNYAASAHWHRDIELISVLAGHMLYNVNGTVIRLEEGEGIIVNARQMHYNYSDDETECNYIVAVLHPMLLCAGQTSEDALVAPLLADPALAYVHLRPQVPWEAEILQSIRSIYEYRDFPSAPLHIQSLFCGIWATLYDNMDQCMQRFKNMQNQDQKLNGFKEMITYIQKNYQDKVTLQDIAKAGGLSRSGCVGTFRHYLDDTPINFLINYRLKLGADLLQTTGLSVTEIAYQVGFSNASYFAEAFRKTYRCTPVEYRNSKAPKG